MTQVPTRFEVLRGLAYAPPIGIRLIAITVSVTVLALWSGGTGSQEEPADFMTRVREDGSVEVTEVYSGRLLLIIPPGEPPGTLAEAVAMIPQVPGWPVPTEGYVTGPPAVGDLDGDGALEVVFGDREGWLYAADADGTLLPGFPRQESGQLRTPALGEMDGQPGLEIGAVSFGVGTRSGELHLVRHDGSNLPGWPILPGEPTLLSGATFGDLDGDGGLDLVAEPAGSVVAHRADATPVVGWPAPLDRALENGIAPAAVADVDGDGRAEVFLGTQDNKVYTWASHGGRLPGFPVLLPSDVDGEITVADFDGDGFLELAASPSVTGVYLLEMDGSPMPGWPQPAGRGSDFGIAVGDLDGDGSLEIAASTVGGNGRVYVWNAEDGTAVPGWPVEVPFFSFQTTPVIADLDGDGQPDIAAGGGTASFSSSGRIYAWHADGTRLDGFPILLPTGFAILGSHGLTVADIDQDGDVDLLAGAATGSLCGGCPGRVFAFDLGTAYDPSTMHWPTQSHDFQRSGLYTPPDRRPVAVAHAPAVVECASPTRVRLDGSASSDPDSTPGTHDDIVRFQWYEAFGTPGQVLLGEGEILEVELALGTHEITLRVTDAAGASDTDTVVVTIVDTLPPTLAVVPEPPELWPPNHRMVEVTAIVSATDLCSTPSVVLESVTSSEPDDAPGNDDGVTSDDIQDAAPGSADYLVSLRAERSGSGPGRTYRLTYRASDGAGNPTVATGEVSVPHDRGIGIEPVWLSASETAAGTVVEWAPVPGAWSYSVIRGEVANLRDSGARFDLGPVACLASETQASSVAADSDAPSPGGAYFYLVGYDDGLASGYGTSTAAKECAPAPGGGCP